MVMLLQTTRHIRLTHPTTAQPTWEPTTPEPTPEPTTAEPTTVDPTVDPTTGAPTGVTVNPTTAAPTSATINPTTAAPTTAEPTTAPVEGDDTQNPGSSGYALQVTNSITFFVFLMNIVM
eukprot:431130_1